MKKEPINPFAAKVIKFWFEHRHDDEFCREMFQSVVRDAQLWRKYRGPVS